MLKKIPSILNYLILPILVIILYLNFNGILSNKNLKIISLSNSNLSEYFLSSLPLEKKSLNDHLLKFNFIDSFFFKLSDKKILVEINMHEAFAKNNKNKQIIFNNNAISDFIYFKKEFIDNILLEDTSKTTSYFDIMDIMNLKKIDYFKNFIKIETIDNRRLDVYLIDGRRIMLPKTLDTKLIVFLNEFLPNFLGDVNFKNYLDLRNFATNSIRMK